jgi:hypothetical protein
LAAGFENRPIIKRYVAKTTPTVPIGASPPLSGPAFSNQHWDVSQAGNTTPVQLDTEVQFLPRGVRARVVKRPAAHFETPGIILFDKQGRLAQRKWGIVKDTDPAVDGGEKLIEAIGPDELGVARELPITNTRVTGVAVAIYNDADVPDPKNPESWIETNATQLTVGTQSGELVAAP